MDDPDQLRDAANAFCESLHGTEPPHDQAIAGFRRIKSIRLLVRVLKFAAWVAVIIALIAGAGAWYYYRQVQTFTSVEPRQLPIASVPDGRLKVLAQQVQEIEQPATPDAPPREPIELTAELINGLIARNDRLRGRAYVEIADGIVHADVSLPTEIPGAKGRYFNGRVSITFSWSDHRFEWTIVGVEANGQQVPIGWLESLLREKIQRVLAADPRIEQWLRKFETIEIRDDRVVLVPDRDAAPETLEPSQDSPSSGGDSSGGDSPTAAE